MFFIYVSSMRGYKRKEREKKKKRGNGNGKDNDYKKITL